MALEQPDDGRVEMTAGEELESGAEGAVVDEDLSGLLGLETPDLLRLAGRSLVQGVYLRHTWANPSSLAPIIFPLGFEGVGVLARNRPSSYRARRCHLPYPG